VNAAGAATGSNTRSGNTTTSQSAWRHGQRPATASGSRLAQGSGSATRNGPGRSRFLHTGKAPQPAAAATRPRPKPTPRARTWLGPGVGEHGGRRADQGGGIIPWTPRPPRYRPRSRHGQHHGDHQDGHRGASIQNMPHRHGQDRVRPKAPKGARTAPSGTTQAMARQRRLRDHGRRSAAAPRRVQRRHDVFGKTGFGQSATTMPSRGRDAAGPQAALRTRRPGGGRRLAGPKPGNVAGEEASGAQGLRPF
jgi:hypothetical protein